MGLMIGTFLGHAGHHDDRPTPISVHLYARERFVFGRGADARN
uniref:Uncharacterized protein n=1 Tax=Anopheles christyi TaxID=43041 RepID=A0A182KJ39_9DIPT